MIRKVTQNDLAECVDVIKSSFLTVADEFGFTVANALRFTAFATTIERLHWHFENEIIRIVEGHSRNRLGFIDNEKIIGYYSLALQANNQCELNNLCVLPEFRHQKIGEKLLLHSFETAKALGCSKMNIGIVEDNQRLRKWYEKFGFTHTGTQKFDFFPFTCGYLERELH